MRVLKNVSARKIQRICLAVSGFVLLLFMLNVVLGKIANMSDWDPGFIVRKPWVEWLVLFGASGLFTVSILLSEYRKRATGADASDNGNQTQPITE